MIEFGKKKVFKEHCPVCGLAIYEGDKGCPKYHLKKHQREVVSRENLGKIGAKTGLGEIQNSGQVDIYTRLASYLNVLLGLIGIIASIYIIYAGIKWLRASGNEQIVTEAKDTIKSAIYGLIVVFGAYAIVNFVVLKLIGSIK